MRDAAGATTWADLVVEMLPRVALSGATHAALDQVLADELAAGRRGPTFRFWEWDRPLVVIGSFQSVRNEVDPDGAARHGVGVVRRISGGGAMFMEPEKCITYSLIVPVALVAGMSFTASYAFLDRWVMGALAAIGVQARYVPINDIATDAGKIAGAAQKRLASGVVVHHVTMAHDIDAVKMLDVLRIGGTTLSEKGIRSANKVVDPLRSQTGLSRDAVMEAFEAHFRGLYGTSSTAYRPEELTAASELVRTKFGTTEWTHRVP